MAARWTRRELCIRTAGAAVAAAVAPFVGGMGNPGVERAQAAPFNAAADNAGRAAEAYTAMQRYFYDDRQKLYREHYPQGPGDGSLAYFWTFEEAARATLCMFGLPGGAQTYGPAIQDRLNARERYWDGGSYQRAYFSNTREGDRYYDDNSWAGSDLLQHALLTSGQSSATALDRARGVLRFIVETGWFGYPGAEPGGIFWVNSDSNQDRGTGSTGGATKLAAHMFHATGRTDWIVLYWAMYMYNWVRSNLLSPDNGLYWDKVLPDGSIDTNQWIYNQGIMIGASVLLHRAASAGRDGQFGDPAAYLAHAEDLAARTLAAYSSDPYYSGERGAYRGRSIFNAIFWRNLLLLYAVNKNQTYLQKMQAYADKAWNDRAFRDPKTSLFKDDPAAPAYWLLDQAGMVQVYACLGWDARNYGKLT